MDFTPGPPNARFRDFRKLFHRFIGPHSYGNINIQDILQHEIKKLVGNLLNGKGKNFLGTARE
jgi:hypothetical protein